MKNIYFVRHGQSESNAGGLRQGFGGKLSEKGKAQASFVAKRVSSLDIEFILASSSPRAKQTAEIINTKLALPIEFTRDLRERDNPERVIGMKSDDPEATKIASEIMEKYYEPDFKYEESESFNELKERALGVLDNLKILEKDNILVVTHGSFLRVVLSAIIYGNELKPEHYIKLFEATATRNTGLTWCQYNEERIPNPWSIITYNDHSHLGDD